MSGDKGRKSRCGGRKWRLNIRSLDVQGLQTSQGRKRLEPDKSNKHTQTSNTRSGPWPQALRVNNESYLRMQELLSMMLVMLIWRLALCCGGVGSPLSLAMATMPAKYNTFLKMNRLDILAMIPDLRVISDGCWVGGKLLNTSQGFRWDRGICYILIAIEPGLSIQYFHWFMHIGD